LAVCKGCVESSRDANSALVVTAPHELYSADPDSDKVCSVLVFPPLEIYTGSLC